MRGIVVGKESTTDLIVRATEQDIARFAKNTVVGVAPVSNGHVDYMGLVGATLYDESGRPVALVQDTRCESRAIEVTSFGDDAPRFIHGGLRVEIRAVGI